MTETTQTLNYLGVNKDRFQKEYHLKRIGIFGSFARGEQTEKSDIDILVEFEDGTDNLFDLKQMLRTEIQSIFRVPVDICREKYIKPFFKDQILREVKYA
ncbi:MAG: nucleotidyltransferase family protein [Bacteroidales bacterium]|nr:nucleotidyltransferase family protein [Bacteroidales bacterium]